MLETGGKAPFVVLDDADLDAAVAAAAFGAFANSGQICMSTERIVVDASIADAFVAKLADKAASLPLGDPRQGSVVLGSLIDMKAVERCNALIDDALAHGATLVCGGKADSTLFPATLLDHVTPAMRIYAEESFGPVKGIVRVDGEDAAIRCANDNAFGLSSAVFSRDVARAMRVAARIESGICHVNGPTVHDEAQMPFGGVKDSGFGHFGGWPASRRSRTCAGSPCRPHRATIRSDEADDDEDCDSGRRRDGAAVRRAAGRKRRGRHADRRERCASRCDSPRRVAHR